MVTYVLMDTFVSTDSIGHRLKIFHAAKSYYNRVRGLSDSQLEATMQTSLIEDTKIEETVVGDHYDRKTVSSYSFTDLSEAKVRARRASGNVVKVSRMRINKLSHSYGRYKVLEDVDIKIEPG